MFYKMRYNVVFVGNVSTGKTSIIQQYLEKPSATTSTLAVDFIPIEIDTVQMSLWDTCGQERFAAITSSYFARGHVFVLVHDIRDESPISLQKWYKEIEKNTPRHEPVVVVVSNKTDLHPFAATKLTDWIKEHGFDQIYTSAMSGEGIEALFSKIKDAVVVHQTDWLSPSLPSLPVTAQVTSPGCSC